MRWPWSKSLRREQTTCVYCPVCQTELISSRSFVSDPDPTHGLVAYRCRQCGWGSLWLFDAPAPLLIYTRRSDDADWERVS